MSAPPHRTPHTRALWTITGGLVLAFIGAVTFSATGLIGLPSVLGALAAYALAAVLITTHWHRGDFGLANTITLSRVIGTSWIASLTFATAIDHIGRAGQVVMIVVGTICLILDGVDGRVARRRGEASPFGARFDMETDAAMLLFLSFAVPLMGVTGWWAVGIGLWRYVYVAASWISAPLRRPVRYSYARKVVAVIQGIGLLVALTLDLVPSMPGWVPSVPVAIALALLTWSFGRDAAWQFGQARNDRRVGIH